jgi:hypothetical protein
MHWAWVALAYVSYLAIVSMTRPAFRRARRPLIVVGIVAWIVAITVWRSGGDRAGDATTAVILPALVLLVGYWISGLLFVEPDLRLEGWLRSVDERVFARLGARAGFRRAPGAIATYFEVSYVLVYAVVPGGAVTLAAAGHGGQIDRFWTVVLLSEFICYGMLPWLQTRPPRVLEVAGGRDGSGPSLVRRVNLGLVDRASIQATRSRAGMRPARWPRRSPSVRRCRWLARCF